jgi:hypothetical protein
MKNMQKLGLHLNRYKKKWERNMTKNEGDHTINID